MFSDTTIKILSVIYLFRWKPIWATKDASFHFVVT